MTREEFNNNSYLVNNNALYNKHTEHISTTEPLYLDGMGGSDNIVHKKSANDGGDTPEPQTLFSLEIESGRFISFYFQSGVLYANTDDGSSVLWVLDSDGVVIDNISYSIADRAPILEQINEHYGTSFTGWSDNEIGLRFGDTVPNWNAYEKIELALIAINIPELYGDSYPFGSVKGSTYEMQANGNKIIRASSDGVVVSLWGTPLEGQSLDLVKQKMAENGYPITSVVLIQTSLKLDDSVENWNSYSIINV